MIKESKMIYSVLFLKGRTGSDIKELASILKMKRSEVEKSIKLLENELLAEESPIVIRWIEDRVSLTVSKDMSETLSQRMDKTVKFKLSKSALETLTIVAYNQPITKSQIEQIRGVAADYAMNKLLDLELVEEVGVAETRGNPRLFGTTTSFLEMIGVSSINELPEMPEDIASKEEENLFNYE